MTARMARATWSRGASSSTKRSPLGVVQRRALAADGLGDEEALAAADAGDRGGMELDELEVGERGPGGAGEQQAGAERARRVGRARPQRRGAAGGEDHGAGGERAPVVGVEAGGAAVGRDAQRGGAAALEDVDPGVLGDRGAQLAQDPPAGGAAAGVGDAAARVAALEAEREVAVAVGVEAHAEALEVAEARGRLLGEDARRRRADDAAAGRERVLEVQRGRVVVGERGGEPALRPVGRRLGQRAGGDQRDPGALARRAERGVEAGGAGAHDDEVGPVHR